MFGSLETVFGMKGKNVVVTGGSKGIGLMLAAGFVQQGEGPGCAFI
jgi:NAD(P)-dependent dehydrogenase (short-subunit alcohol dehydrogenase family)